MINKQEKVGNKDDSVCLFLNNNQYRKLKNKTESNEEEISWKKSETKSIEESSGWEQVVIFILSEISFLELDFTIIILV